MTRIPKALFLGAAAAVGALALAACGANQGAAGAPAASPLLIGDTALDLTYNQLGTALADNWGALTAAQHATAHSLSAKIYAAVTAADAAETLGDATTVAAQTAAVATLIGQVNQLLPAKAQIKAPAPAAASNATTGG